MDHPDTLQDFFSALQAIYNNRTTGAKVKDFFWEVGDFIIGAMVAVGLTALAVKLAPFIAASLPGLATTQGQFVVGSVGAEITGILLKWFNSEHSQLKDAITADVGDQHSAYSAMQPGRGSS